MDQHELLADYLPYATTVTVPHPPPRIPRCRDAFDQCFLELALAGNADALVSGDQDLLALATQFPVPVIELPVFLMELDRGP